MKKFLDNFEEYLCAVGLIVMTVVSFLGVISRKLPQVNLSWTMELVTTMFVFVCALASAAAFKTNSHMGFSFATDKLKGTPGKIYKWVRVGIIYLNYALWIVYGGKMVMDQYKTGLKTAVMATPGWMIGIAIPISAILTTVRIMQYELGYKFTEHDSKVKGGEKI